MRMLLLQIPQTLAKLPILLHRYDLSRLAQQQLRKIANTRPNLQHRILRPNVRIGHFPPQHTTVIEKILPKLLTRLNAVLL